MKHLRLGVNVDHVATLRNARGGEFPDPVRAAKIAAEAGADGITAHLREDRRHIQDRDLERLVDEVELPLNFEMAATSEMLGIAKRLKPHAVCIVPEKRIEITTEGGLNVAGQQERLKAYCGELADVGSRVSLFIEADKRQLEASINLGVPVVELHAGTYCDSDSFRRGRELKKLIEGAAIAQEMGLECHVGHGLNFENVEPVAAIPSLVEVNIGHFLIGEAIFLGLRQSIEKMRRIIDNARS
ncbi:MAG: pyridoxine 5'-phosphate synthase [Rhodospirillaceae bacterium]|nr:pyridoxine 5'-phosphate synthase [Rhodospirillaceae bacterium]|tara:strand:+ start:489 stop:1217 length:729 start_codon:yes stop_codon:yes gene_type:complete